MFFLEQDIFMCIYLLLSIILLSKIKKKMTKEGGSTNVLEVLGLEENLGLGHEVSVSPSVIWIAAATVVSTMVGVYVVRMIFGD